MPRHSSYHPTQKKKYKTMNFNSTTTEARAPNITSREKVGSLTLH